MKLSDVNEFGTLSLANFSRKHAEMLAASARPEIAARAPTVLAGVAGLSEAYSGSRPLRALWTAAVLLKDQADNELDREISATSYDLLSPAQLKGDRSSPVFRVLFHEGNLEFIYGPEREELVRVGAMVTYLEQHPEHPAAPRAPALREKAARLDAALPAATAAEHAYRAAQKVEREQRQALLRILRKSVTFLRDQLETEAEVEAYFPTIAESRVTEEK